MIQAEYKALVEYACGLANAIPYVVYEGTASVFCIGLVIFIAWKGFKKGLCYASILLLLDYIFLIFCSTVFCRATSEARRYDFHPFWSYRVIQNGMVEYLPENIMNVVVFVPVGLLLGVAFRNMTWWRAFLIGFVISVSIETLQLVFYKGFSEIDDVIHNTLGCLIGYFACQICRLRLYH